MNYSVLLADDDAAIRFVLSKSLSRAGFKVQATDNAQTLMKWVKNGAGDVVLTDVHMETDDIFNFIPDLKRIRPDLPIIVMSANTNVATALKSGSSNVFEYIPKPFDLGAVQDTLKRALGGANKGFKSRVSKAEPMIGKSLAMQPVFKAISDYMSGDIPMYIYGDVGTGKNHTAKVLHEAGRRGGKPFVSFIEIDSFENYSELIDGGDLFVDRVHELRPRDQALLLRIVEANENLPSHKRIRIICTADISPQTLQEMDLIRPDLYFHLMGGNISLPSLRFRVDDIAELASYFLNSGRPVALKSLTQEAHTALKAYHWPGNVRELKSIMQKAALKYSDKTVSDLMLKKLIEEQLGDIKNNNIDDLGFETIRAECRTLLGGHKGDDTPYTQARAWVEKPLIEEALRITNGNNLRAADLLGIHRNTLRTKIKSLGIVQ